MREFIIEKLNKMIPTPKVELNYFSDFSLLISIILSNQSQDKNVNKVTPILFSKYGTPFKMAKAKEEEIKEIIKSLGLSNIKSSNIIKLSKELVTLYKGQVPLEYEKLISLPGVGNKTAKVFLIEFCNGNYFPVDTHVKRVSYRLGISKKNESPEKVEAKLNAYFKNENLAKLHQQFVLHGRYICLAKKPKCEGCLLKERCPYFK